MLRLQPVAFPSRTDPLFVAAPLGRTHFRVEFGHAAVAAWPSGIAVTGTMAWFGRQLGTLSPEALRKTDGVAARTALNTVGALLLIGPLDRGGAAVEIEAIDPQTGRQLAALRLGHFAPPGRRAAVDFVALPSGVPGRWLKPALSACPDRKAPRC